MGFITNIATSRLSSDAFAARPSRDRSRDVTKEKSRRTTSCNGLVRDPQASGQQNLRSDGVRHQVSGGGGNTSELDRIGGFSTDVHHLNQGAGMVALVVARDTKVRLLIGTGQRQRPEHGVTVFQ